MYMTKTLPEQIQDSAKATPQEWERPVAFDQVVSTGSTLLDLAISGGVVPGGGLPGRIIIQLSGQNSTGKTTLAASTLAYVQDKGGKYRINDFEARLIASYCQTFGAKLNQDHIERGGTITDLFEGIIGPLETKKIGNTTVTKRNNELAWTPDKSHINMLLVDALAAAASKTEKEKGDKMGMKPAKDFSEGFRLIMDHIYNHNILMFCTDQVRDKGTDFHGNPIQDTGGGNAIGFYASLRVTLRKIKDLVKEVWLPGMPTDAKGNPKGEKHVYGIEVEAYVRKSSLDRPYRRAKLRLLFNYGYDDIGANLEWLKEHGAMGTEPGYRVVDQYFPANTKGGALEAAIEYVEQNNLEDAVKEAVIDVWGQIEEQVKPKRKPKER
jgi:RecA/RadA recombinase